MKDTTWAKWMRFGAAVGCHQLAERSFFIGGYQFPVCARCTGLPIGWIAALPVFLLLRPPLFTGLLLLVPMLLDWGLQALGVLPSTNARRLITGVLGGCGYLLTLCAAGRMILSAIANT